MKITGRFVLRIEDGYHRAEWTGGDVAVIDRAILDYAWKSWRLNSVGTLWGIPIRIWQMDFDVKKDRFTGNVVVMRESWKARLWSQYSHVAFKLTTAWCQVVKYRDGAEFPRWSVPEILYRPLQIVS